MSEPVDHFLTIASHGRQPGASSGAIAARRIAEVIIDEVPRLDFEALNGLIVFVMTAKLNNPEARAIVESWPKS